MKPGAETLDPNRVGSGVAVLVFILSQSIVLFYIFLCLPNFSFSASCAIFARGEAWYCNMSLLGTINPNMARSQSVVSHNMPQLPSPGEEEGDGPYVHHEYEESEKSNSGATLLEEEEKIEERVGSLVRQLTRHSTRYSVSGNLENPFTSDNTDSAVNPNSPNFSVRSWMKNLLAIRSRDPDSYPNRTAGISFRNLSVHGFGSPTDYQKDVLNSLFEIGTMIRRLLGSKLQKIQILREFDGLVKSGEMLVVLGKPGSGCSTLLKTIAGEMSGISMSEESVLNYEGELILISNSTPYTDLFDSLGISAEQMQKNFKGEAIYSAETEVHFPQLSVG